MSAVSASMQRPVEGSRVAPYSVEAEQAVLGGLLLDNGRWHEVADILREEDFYREDHRLIFRAITSLTAAGQPFDAILLSEWMQCRGELELVGGLAYLATLARDTPTSANVRAYADIVRERAARRQLIQIGRELSDSASNANGVTAAEIAARVTASLTGYARTQSGLVVLPLAELLARELPLREVLLKPWLPIQGLAMIYAPRGTGKTHLSLGVAFAVASGGKFLRWEAPQPAGVLFVDGELPAAVLQERLARLVQDGETQPTARLDILTPDFQPCGIPDLGTERGQAELDGLIRPEHRLIVLDNLSALLRSGKENEGESWLPVQTWALRHRAAGRSILFIHHSGKGGQQRGTSRREDLLDSVIALRLPTGYSPQDGASFEVHFEKARQLFGDDVKPFEARLGTDDAGCGTWTMRDLDDSTFERVVALHADGLKPREICEELGIHRSQVSRHLKRAREKEHLETQQ